MQKPFGSPIVHLVGFALVQFDFQTLATVFAFDVNSKLPIKLWKHVFLKGIIAASRSLDAATDLETAYFIFARAAHRQCMWLDGEQHCSKVHALGVAMLAFAAVDLCVTVSNMFLSKRYSDHDRRFFWPGVTVHVVSLLCELGIVSGAITEARVSRLIAARHDTSTQSSGLTVNQHTAYLVVSIMLTFISFIVGLFGVQCLFQAAKRSSQVFVQHVRKRSAAGCSSRSCCQSHSLTEESVAGKAEDTHVM
jgi:hypothetical protein